MEKPSNCVPLLHKKFSQKINNTLITTMNQQPQQPNMLHPLLKVLFYPIATSVSFVPTRRGTMIEVNHERMYLNELIVTFILFIILYPLTHNLIWSLLYPSTFALFIISTPAYLITILGNKYLQQQRVIRSRPI
jgi:hypothetical protein